MRGLIMAAQQQARVVSPLPPGVTLWLDANQITGLADNDPVAQWNDLSGNAYHATQADAGLRPVYKTGVINGKPVLRFGTKWLTLNRETVGTTGLFCDAGQEFVVIAVSKIAVNLTGTVISRALASAGLRSFHLYYNRPAGANQTPTLVLRGQEIANRTNRQFDDDTAHIHIVTWDAANANFIGDGASLALTVGEGVEQIQDINIGCRTDGAFIFNGDIAEILIYDRMLLAGEIDQMNNYLSEKYDITLA